MLYHMPTFTSLKFSINTILMTIYSTKLIYHDLFKVNLNIGYLVIFMFNSFAFHYHKHHNSKHHCKLGLCSSMSGNFPVFLR